MYKRLIAWEEEKAEEEEEIKTMVHKIQFFYLFVSRRIEEVHTHTDYWRIHIDIHTHAFAYSFSSN